jgi:hypothetical protein
MSRRQVLYIGAVVAILLCGALFFAAKFLLNNKRPDQALGQISENTATTSAQSASLEEASSEAQCGQAEGEQCGIYKNEKYHFSVMLPQSQSAKVFDEGQGATTITFQNISTGYGFQIYIVPYSGTQITNARFKLDEPSGVRTNVSTMVIDGATAAAFDSTNQFLGETHEVWFVRGGYLYEVTTLKPLDSWLTQILTTWKFL